MEQEVTTSISDEGEDRRVVRRAENNIEKGKKIEEEEFGKRRERERWRVGRKFSLSPRLHGKGHFLLKKDRSWSRKTVERRENDGEGWNRERRRKKRRGSELSLNERIFLLLHPHHHLRHPEEGNLKADFYSLSFFFLVLHFSRTESTKFWLPFLRLPLSPSRIWNPFRESSARMSITPSLFSLSLSTSHKYNVYEKRCASFLSTRFFTWKGGGQKRREREESK